jgi:hypothetical protein
MANKDFSLNVVAYGLLTTGRSDAELYHTKNLSLECTQTPKDVHEFEGSTNMI